MMYRIDLTISVPYFKEVCLGDGREGVKEIDFPVTLPRNCNDAEEVLNVIPRLLDMISEGKASTIKILSYEDK